jgi:hypothetical protein
MYFAVGALIQSRPWAGLAAIGALNALPQSSIWVVVVRALAEAGVREVVVVGCAIAVGAVLWRIRAGHASGAAWLAEEGNRGRNELPIGASGIADSLSNILVVGSSRNVRAFQAGTQSGAGAGSTS